MLSPDLQRNRNISTKRPVASLKLYYPIEAQRSTQELTEQHGKLSARFKFNQFINAFIESTTGQLRGCPVGDM